MNKLITHLCALTILLAFNVHAEDAKPIKALMITGGGYHDYTRQQHILAEGLSARANIEWTIEFVKNAPGGLPEIFTKEGWAKGYDVILHNECFASYSDPTTIERIVNDHIEAKVGVILIHCAMHTFRGTTTREWDNLQGVQSNRHGAQFPISVKTLASDNPIMKGVPADWKTPMGELYHTKLLENATALAEGTKDGDQKTAQACLWTSEYKGIKTFGCTLGHHNVTMLDPVYLDVVSRGVLWVAGKLGQDGKPVEGYEGSGKLFSEERRQELLGAQQQKKEQPAAKATGKAQIKVQLNVPVLKKAE
ncbi:MAG: ThuA domain-containing protein [Planctomycetota bacterium]|nr:ThuA domain-containing protein [Planctomycetota bacterium]MDA1140809.1 ThuA domain-containing protein [Planctomycetota bacterium]